MKTITEKIRTQNSLGKANFSPIVDWNKQKEEKNICWRDFPMKNAQNNRKLKRPMCYYYDTWEEYMYNHQNDDYII